ncbi:MAG TPA: hypothetical protein VMW27_16040 [Thermoanaerobaculia bacterium]|nr:hypothetical protein [Thermoanaerobaculia bacterium]
MRKHAWLLALALSLSMTGLARGQQTDPGPGQDVKKRCIEKFGIWNEVIHRRLGHERYTAIAFTPNGEVCKNNRDFGVAGDLIYTAIYVAKEQKNDDRSPAIQFTKCDLQSPIPNNPEGGNLLPETQDGEGWLNHFPVRQCFGTSAEMRITGTTNPDPVNFTLPMYERYRYTLQGGVISTSQHAHSFGLRPDGSVQRVFDKGPVDDGPEYVASIVLYALPRYFQTWVRHRRGAELEGLEALVARTYAGRDVLHDNGIYDRIGLVFGAGLSNPNDRFVAGLSFEIIPGVNGIGVYEYAKLKELAGVKEGDPFTGTEDKIPVREVWERKVVLGVSLDMRFVMGLLRRSS